MSVYLKKCDEVKEVCQSKIKEELNIFEKYC